MSERVRLLAGRAVLVLSGPEVFGFLERVVTNAVADWGEGEARYGALLTPQGKVIADFNAVRLSDEVWLDVAAGIVQALAQRLNFLKLRAKVVVAVREDWRVAVVSAGDGGQGEGSGGWRDPRAQALPVRVFTQSTVPEMDGAEWRALAVAACVPEWGADFQEADVFPADINMDFRDGVDFRKGCFIGQEVVSRMKRRGTARRRTLGLVFDGLAPEPGSVLLQGEDEIGVVTSRAGALALARVRIDRLKDGVGLRVGEVEARIDVPDWLAFERAALAEG
jgi:folate-binding protein YgfZ